MKKLAYYTIRKLDYKTIQNSIHALKNNSSLSLNEISLLQTLLEDHQELTRVREKVLKAQQEECVGLFQDWEKIHLNTELSPQQQTEISDENQPNQNEKSQGSSPQENPPEYPKPNAKKKGKKTLPKGKEVYHTLSESEKVCPCCQCNMHKQRSATKTIVLAMPMLKTETHISESYRCLTCETNVTAKENQQIANQCIGRYHFSAVSSLAALRYMYGMPSYRLDKMSTQFGMRISDSTQWHLFEEAASLLRPFYQFMEKTAAQAPTYHTDDTHNTVLSIIKNIEAEQEAAIRKGKNPNTVRSGIHTTNLTGVFPQGQLVIFKTGLHHAGEILAKVFEKRSISEQLVIMSDASSCITSEIEKTKKISFANCNSHANRKFKDLAKKEKEIFKQFGITKKEVSEVLTFLISKYKQIFEHDKYTKEKLLSPMERLLYHHKNSYPLMEEIRSRILHEEKEKTYEPNSEQGKVFRYFTKHFETLCAFCKVENAPICNNLSERMLKSVIRHRKNSLFYKNQLGAYVADLITSILFSAEQNGLVPKDYLRDLLSNRKAWKENPEAWLPWNYLQTIESLKSSAP